MARKRWDPSWVAQIVHKAEQLGLSYIEAAERFGIPVWRIYRFTHARNEAIPPVALPAPPPQDSSPSSCDEKAAGEPTHSEDSSAGPALPSSDGAVCEEPERGTGAAQLILGSASSSPLPEQVRGLVVNYKRENPDCGFKRIEQYLRNTYFLVVPRKRIRQVLKEAGLLESNDSSFDRTGGLQSAPKGTRRFEASAPGELYQMDITYVYISGLKVLYLINVIDDHSRFCLRSALRSDQSADTLIEVLHDVIAEYGKPKKLLTDEGSAFYSWSWEKTKFQQYLDDLEIEHVVADPHSPTTTGKIERFHQTIKQELIRKVKFGDYADAVAKIKAYVHHYNHERPHQSLAGARPADRFMGVSSGRAGAQAQLVEKELELGKGYLLFKLGAHEVSIVLKPDQTPEILVNGVMCRPQERSS